MPQNEIKSITNKIYLTKMKSNCVIYKEGDPIKKIYIIKSGLVCQFKKVYKKDLSPKLLADFEQVFNKVKFPINIPIKNLSDGFFLGYESFTKWAS